MDVRVLPCPGLPGTAAFAPVEELALINPEADRAVAVAALGEAIAHADCGVHPDVADHWVEQVIPSETSLLDVVIEREVSRRSRKPRKGLLIAASTAAIVGLGGAGVVMAQSPDPDDEVIIAAFDSMGYDVASPSPSQTVSSSPSPSVTISSAPDKTASPKADAAKEARAPIAPESSAPSAASNPDEPEPDSIQLDPIPKTSSSADSADAEPEQSEAPASASPEPSPDVSTPEAPEYKKEAEQEAAAGLDSEEPQKGVGAGRETRIFTLALNNFTRHETVFRAWVNGNVVKEYRLDPWGSRVVDLPIRVPLSAETLAVTIMGARGDARPGTGRELLKFNAAKTRRESARPRLMAMSYGSSELADPTKSWEATGTGWVDDGFLRVSVIEVSQPDDGASGPASADG